MSFQPTLDRVLVRPIEAAKKTPGGILLPENNSQSKLARGEVICVGPGICQNGELIAVALETGDIVTYIRGAGVDVVNGYEKSLLLREGDILGYEVRDN